MIRVGRIVDGVQPKIDGFKPIVVLMKSSKYYSLSPYSLRTQEGHIMENIWQFSKVYKTIPASRQTYSRYDNTVIWEHPAEAHLDQDGNLTNAYWNWRSKGYNNPHAVRYPVGFHHRTKCLYSYYNGKNLNYIEARKEIYMPIYIDLVKEQAQFKELKELLRKGVNLLILEVDGPHQESLQYYKDKYSVDDNFITNNTIIANEKNLDIMLNDAKHNFGHGYCLAMALLDKGNK
jgi:hypothetical protein